MNNHHTLTSSKLPAVLALFIAGLTAMALLVAGSASVSAQSEGKSGKPTPPAKPSSPNANQTAYGFPLTVTVKDNLQMDIRYRDSAEYQFYGEDAEGVYLWVNVGGVTKVYGPGQVPAGRPTNPYTPISNAKAGSGTPGDPWVITTQVGVPDTNLRLTHVATYVNGAEFVRLDFHLSQVGGTTPITATLFHAADLYTAGSDSGYGYYDASTGGVGDYYTRTDGIVLYQQFVPSVPANAYMESYYSTIWNAIGSTSGPGQGFNNTVITDTRHDAGVGLQWNLTVPANGSVTVGDTDLFSPHASLCGSFSDVAYGSFNYEFIYYLACNGIVNGYGDTTFRPGNPITRGQLSKMVSNSAGWNEPAVGQTFEDVAPGTTFYTYTERIASRGFINGYPCGGPGEPCGVGNKPYFRPNANASRGQISKIVSNAMGWTEPHTEQSFQDVPADSTFYIYVQRMVSRSVIGGYPCGSAGEPCVAPGNLPYYRPGHNATRGQVSKIVANSFFPTCCGRPQP
ncbi:MAG: S-layer homology domain-containing protein [Chloroflexota bacterium]